MLHAASMVMTPCSLHIEGIIAPAAAARVDWDAMASHHLHAVNCAQLEVQHCNIALLLLD
jgi:hypothetical protein